MNLFVFALTTWVLFGLELGLKDTLRLGPHAVAPSFVLPLAVFIATYAPAITARWACLLLGLLMDLTSQIDIQGGEAVTAIGPYALGYLLACQFVLAVRGMMIRKNPLTLVVLTILAGVIMQILVVAILSAREIYDPIVWSAGSQLVTRLLSSLYTGVTAFICSLILIPMMGLFAFHQPFGRRTVRMRS